MAASQRIIKLNTRDRDSTIRPIATLANDLLPTYNIDTITPETAATTTKITQGNPKRCFPFGSLGKDKGRP